MPCRHVVARRGGVRAGAATPAITAQSATSRTSAAFAAIFAAVATTARASHWVLSAATRTTSAAASGATELVLGLLRRRGRQPVQQ